MIKYTAVESNHKGCYKVETNGNLILTGWGYAEYVASEMNAGLSGNLELKSGRIPDKLEDATRLHVRRVYEKYGQNLTRAAEALDVSRNTVRKYL